MGFGSFWCEIGLGTKGGPFGLTMVRRWCETKDLDLQTSGQIPTYNCNLLKEAQYDYEDRAHVQCRFHSNILKEIAFIHLFIENNESFL